MDVTPWIDQKAEAVAAHVSQANPNSLFRRLDESIRRAWTSKEYLTLAASRLDSDHSRHNGSGRSAEVWQNDLFAGLR